MSNLSEEEALALIAVRGHCDDLDAWRCDPGHEGIWELEGGVQDEAGARHDQFVHLHVTQSPIPGYGIRFLFTLFRRTKFENERIYQLDLRFGYRRMKSPHQCSHEHFGSARAIEAPEGRIWEFEHALARFCQRSNIYFIPPPPSPLIQLKEKGHAKRRH